MLNYRNPLGRWLLLAAVLCSPAAASAQVGMTTGGTRFELDAGVQVPRVVGELRAQLDRVDALLEDGQWAEAVDTLLAATGAPDDRLVPVTEHRFVGLREYGRLKLAHLPPEALEVYRSRIDPIARQWYEEGRAGRDRRLLQQVVEEAFASRFGDKALLLLGEMALERGEFASARRHWERILPVEAPPDVPRTWLNYPDTDLDVATVRARLVLVSILEGSAARAADELEHFRRLHPEARGRLGGREVEFAPALAELLEASRRWPPERQDPYWPTFAGSPGRNAAARAAPEAAAVAWREPLPEAGPKAAAALAFHPIWSAGLVFAGSHREVFGFRVADGSPAWEGAGRAVFREELEGVVDRFPTHSETFGAPQFTLTIDNNRLYARLGSAVTAEPLERGAVFRPGYLVCLDLRAEGRLAWRNRLEEGWAFEGPPVGDGTNVFVGTRRSDVRPQAHLAAFDAETGRRRWQRFLCAADTPARGLMFQATHNLVTQVGETLYYNTNLGAVAAVSAEDGRVRWLSLYPRARSGDSLNPAPHWNRAVNPCVHHQGTLLVAPSDSPRIFAFDAATGQMLWQSGPETEGIVHLLGTTEQHLIAGGDRLYWIALDGPKRGRIEHVWPDGPDRPGFGRGVLAGPYVYWPTRDRIYVFDQQTAEPVRAIDLMPLGAAGGNLLVADGRLLIATETELIALDEKPQGAPQPEVTTAGGPPAPELVAAAHDGLGVRRFIAAFGRPDGLTPLDGPNWTGDGTRLEWKPGGPVPSPGTGRAKVRGTPRCAVSGQSSVHWETEEAKAGMNSRTPKHSIERE